MSELPLTDSAEIEATRVFSENSFTIAQSSVLPKKDSKWSLLLPLTSFHFGGSDQDRITPYNEENLGLGFKRVIKDTKNWELSLSAGVYMNSYHGIPDEFIPDPDAPTITPFSFVGIQYKFSKKIQCGIEGGFINYFGNMPQAEIHEDTHIGVVAQLACHFDLARGYGIQLGYVPGDEITSGESPSIATVQLTRALNW